MIQILGLREFVDKQTGEVKRYDAFFDNGWRAANIFDLFENVEKYVEMIPEDQRWNMYYTVANCTDKKRQFLSQDVIALDVDGIAPGTEDQVAKCILDELGLPYDKVGIIYSGNGVHLLIGTTKTFNSAAELKEIRPHYKALLGRCATALFENGLEGKLDPTTLDAARLLRLPFTKNIKTGKPDKLCVVKNRTIARLDVDIFSLADVPSIEQGEHIHPNAYKRFATPDTKAVMSGCSFIKHCAEGNEAITEPMWYAMLSIVGRLENGEELAYKASLPIGDKHSKYTNATPDVLQRRVKTKLDHALESAGPRTCENISSMWEGCKSCPYYKKITSPIQIVGEETVRTKESGFYNIVFKDGVPTQGKPNYDDLVKYFSQQHPYVVDVASKDTYIYTEDYWKRIHTAEIHNFAETHFNPKPSNSMCAEFDGKLKRTNIVSTDFFMRPGLINFNNGILDMHTGKLGPHDKEKGMAYKIPYDFAPRGRCDTFKKFLREVTCGDEQIELLIREYIGYCLSGTHPALIQKAAILFGDGSNGKSVLIKMIRGLVGKENTSSVSIEGLRKDTSRVNLVNKMVNLSTETPNNSFLESDIFKALAAGEEVMVRRLYQDEAEWECTTKLLFACNELPFNNDSSYGMERRLILIPFNATFSHELGNLDPHILEKLLAERSDIILDVLEAFKGVIERGYKFTESRAVKEELEGYNELSDSVARFTAASCVHKPGNKITTDIAYRCYVSWTDDLRLKPTSYQRFAKVFYKHLKNVVPQAERYKSNKARGVENVAIDAVIGL